MNTIAPLLLKWYDANKRDLPWRHTKDPYLIWLCEIIMQQTRIEQGLPYYLRFVEKFPTPLALAQAGEDEILKCWQGLGYYSRARNLHAAAKSMHGVFPTTYEGVRSLKGVGDYTAAAICSIAFDMPYAVVDGNVLRVLSRVFGESTPIDSTEGKHFFAALAQKLLAPHRAGDYNQAIMDFGAMVCTPKAPLCATCPLAKQCKAYLAGEVEKFPVKSQKTKISTRYFHYIYVEQGNDTWLHKRRAGDVWQNLYEPVLIETDTPPFPPDHAQLKKYFGSGKIVALREKPLKHVLSHRIIYADLYAVTLSPSRRVPAEFIRIPQKNLHRYAVSRLVQKLLEKNNLI